MKTVTLSHFGAIEEALRHPDLGQALYDAGAVIMADVLLTLHGEAHKARRELEYRVFKRDFFRYYETEVFPATLRATLAPLLAAGHADLIDLGYRVTINLTADFAGIDRPAQTPEETLRLLALVKTFSEGATLVHSTRPRGEVESEVRMALQTFETQFLAPSRARRAALVAALRRGERAEEDLPRDVLTVLLLHEDAHALPADVLRREMAFYMQAGSHSTANATVHAIHEIFTWCDAHPADRERLLNDPLFLQRCVHESLRLHPASPEAWRKPMQVLRLPSGEEVAPGDRVVLDLYRANRDPSVFGADADVFNPHRNVPRGRLPFGLTFGIGTHTCLGRDLDGGLVPPPGSDPLRHQYGIVTLLVRALLEEGVTRDPKDAPSPDPRTKRPNWGRYPVRFGAAVP